MINKILSVFRKLLSRTVILYFLTAGFILVFADLNIGWNHVVTSVLSRYMPSHDYLIEFNRDRSKLDEKKLKEFELYYRKVSELMTEVPGAHAMTGFCYFYAGKIDRAASEYERAVSVEPKVFNFHYNLGIIALKRHDEVKALEYFKKSTEVRVIDNLGFVVQSRIYKPFLPATRVPEVLAQEMGKHVHQTYRQAYFEVLVLAEKLKDHQAMLHYSQQGVSRGFLEANVGNYYLGLALYGLGKYENAVSYFREAIKQGFHYAQVFEGMGLSLKALGRPESATAFIAAESLQREGKIFKPAAGSLELLIY